MPSVFSTFLQTSWAHARRNNLGPDQIYIYYLTQTHISICSIQLANIPTHPPKKKKKKKKKREDKKIPNLLLFSTLIWNIHGPVLTRSRNTQINIKCWWKALTHFREWSHDCDMLYISPTDVTLHAMPHVCAWSIGKAIVGNCHYWMANTNEEETVGIIIITL